MEYTRHARDQMAARGFSDSDVEQAFVTLWVFECSQDYTINVWGRACDGRKMRVTWVPEVRLIITVAEVNAVTVADMLAAKS